MAITNIKNSTALVLKYEDGKKEDGSPKIASQKFSNVSGVATNEAIYNIGALMGVVLKNPPVEIKKLDDYSLNQE
ncbi:MAG: DUF1659 domain-containing protein [Clostridium sp.]|uniref:DUF1659 domain-containing protein n=1 Tax=Clostridium sp. TaxID=1506 RepID=UPI0030343072